MITGGSGEQELNQIAQRLAAAIQIDEVERWPVGPVVWRDLERFAAASGDVEYLRQRSPSGPQWAPPLFLTSILAWGVGEPTTSLRADGLSRREVPHLGDATVRVVHGGQDVEILQPLTPDHRDVWAGRRIRRADLRRGSSGPLLIIDLETEYVDEHHGALTKCRESVLCLPATIQPAGSQAGRERTAPPEPLLRIHFHAIDLFRFSAVTWNSHRIHLDTAFARSEGFDGPVVQSSLHGIGLVRAALQVCGPGWWCSGVAWRNLAPLVAGQSAHVTAAPVEAPGRGRAFDAQAWRDDGVVLARGTVRLSPIDAVPTSDGSRPMVASPSGEVPGARLS